MAGAPQRSGAMHYWRVPPDAWEAGLRRLQELGLNMVETYVPWGVHETMPGSFDFGTIDPRKDLARFVDLAGELGLSVFLRPGPHINAEMTYFGLPRRVVLDPDMAARSPRGNPVILYFPPKMFPVPSYASERYHEAVAEWYAAVAQIVRPRLHPQGPVTWLQVDNEAGFYFRNGPFCQDYHPDAIARFHTFLEDRYGDLERVCAVHRESYEGWSAVRPPHAFDAAGGEGELARHLDWAAFQEHLLAWSIGRMRRAMERVGLTLPTVHNVSLGDGGLPVSVVAFDAEVDVVGLDYYHPAREHETIKRRTLYLSGSVAAPYSPELGVGAPPWFTPLTHSDSLYCAMAACAYGLRSFNLYMAVDRDRWFGAPIDVQGGLREEATDWKRFLHALNDVHFESLHAHAQVALQWPREYQRLSRATHQLGALSPSNLEAMGGLPTDGCRADTFGFERPVQIAWLDELRRMSAALDAAQIPYVYIDSEAALERYEHVKVVFAPSFEFASAKRWEVLTTLAGRGVHVVYGPTLPTLNDALQPQQFERPGDAAPTSLESAMLHARVHQWIERFDVRRPFATLPPVETCVHRDTAGQDRVLFVLNPGDARVAEITIPRPMILVDALSGERVNAEGEVRIDVAAQTVRMLVIEEPEDAS